MDLIIPDDAKRQIIEQQATSGSILCWTCGTCDSECPIFISTGRLRPQKLVRMANLGMLDELMTLPEIWYCLDCRRCASGCPNQVKPHELIRYVRGERLRNRPVGMETALRNLLGKFQRVRYRAILRAMHRENAVVSEREWYQWMEKPLRTTAFREIVGSAAESPVRSARADPHASGVCFSCNECSNCCPIFYERTVFDPQRIIRMANLGLTDELLGSPSIWMCLGCRQCTENCSQRVSGCEIIRHLRLLAVERGVVAPYFPSRLIQLECLIYPRLLDEIDLLTGMLG